MPDQAHRVRVERLLRGDFKQEDLTRLFLFARGRCGGRDSVKEIGDFVAHHSRRTKGLTTETAQDWFAISAFTVTRFLNPLPTNENLPAIFPAYLQATFRRIQRHSAKNNRAPRPRGNGVERLLLSTIEKFERHADGTFSIIPSRHSPIEHALIKDLCSVIVNRPAFDGDELYKDFAATLTDNAILRKTELADFEKLKPAIILYAVTIMHRCLIKIDNTLSININAMVTAPSGVDGVIEVQCGVPVVNSATTIFCAIFSTSLRADLYCEPALLALPQPWNFELEVTPNIRLGQLI